MATDFELSIYNAVAAVKDSSIIAALPADQRPKVGAWLLRSADTYRAKAAIQRAPADYPQVRLDANAPLAWAQQGQRSFIMNKTTFAPSQCDAWTQFSGSLLMVIVYDRDKISSETPLETAIRKFLGMIYPTMGVAGVNWFSVNGTRRDESSDITRGVLRTVTRLNIPYRGQAKLSQLVA
jgi:hypothetical protein